jgi:hypothetical protein
MHLLITINFLLLIWLVVADMCEWDEWDCNRKGDSCSLWIKDTGDTKDFAWLLFILCSAINLSILITEGWA